MNSTKNSYLKISTILAEAAVLIKGSRVYASSEEDAQTIKDLVKESSNPVAFTDVSNYLYALSQMETFPTIDDVISIIEAAIVTDNNQFHSDRNYIDNIRYIKSQLPALYENSKKRNAA